MVKLPDDVNKASIILSFVNCLLLSMVAFFKSTTFQEIFCPVCNTFLSHVVGKVSIATAGVLASVILLFLSFYTRRHILLQYIAILWTLICIGICVYLLFVQITILRSICYYCVASYILFFAILFYLIWDFFEQRKTVRHNGN